jgi:hypothetical protein
MELISALATRVSPHMIGTRPSPGLYMILDVLPSPHMCMRLHGVNVVPAVAMLCCKGKMTQMRWQKSRIGGKLACGGVRLQAKG